MRKTKGEARRLPRGVKLLSIAAALVLTCVLAVSLIGTSFAAGEETTIRLGTWTPVNGIELSVDAPYNEDEYGYMEEIGREGDFFSEWETAGTAESGDFSLTGKVFSNLISGNNYTAKERTLTIKNTTSSDITLKFKWSKTFTFIEGSVTCTNADAWGTGTFNGTVPAQGSVDLKITSGAGTVQGAETSPYQSITLSKFSVVQADTYTLNLLPAENGTYSATNGTDTVPSAQENKTITYNPESQKITLQAPVAESGYKFCLWEDEYHTPLSTKESYTYQPAKGSSVRAVFVESARVADYISKSGEQYYYWEDAMRAANAATGEGKYIITDNADHSVTLPTDAASASRLAVKDCTYVKEESGVLHYVIPSGVTLVVPYSSAYDTSSEKAVNASDPDNNMGLKGPTGTAYATLTVPQKVVLDVSGGGTLLVNAVQGSTNGDAYHAHVVGDYGKLVVGGTVNVYGTFYARGYVIDANHTATLESGLRTGRIYAYPSAVVYQMLQITDWRGGKYTNAN